MDFWGSLGGTFFLPTTYTYEILGELVTSEGGHAVGRYQDTNMVILTTEDL